MMAKENKCSITGNLYKRNEKNNRNYERRHRKVRSIELTL